ncbi:16S rRNA (cytosine(967)-C(5))-methyltransferase RsmB [Periweissella beninensis]|uniref:16S rRNA (cytosine(967)-C(5))-methyltransferase n=1 Tax=Periweissella beninensis TaxID=504936 RepID=A0ABT0VJW9_9LACO|nr:16S rRNA (cytosine(967)-C(5))-methyltransferase RsmB [Periweissella beninensis]MBM7544671.1 16S rRNA (cytosine967-C5)-methyltransferase [Periweissella beninensis]MCM2437945.1 16S rRNA (cytosine(967)-C(5))-methyltransferase RsmB [Periweissella beninensis]MCT4395729.1 16S rRNA (cytosine(967)-C(5))-methyltransferase RsmB [Periweissella beninensis]
MPKTKRQSARYLAMTTLENIKNGAYSNLQLNAVIKKNDLNQTDVKLFTTLVYGVIQHRLTLEYWLQPFVKQPQKMQPWIRELLYTALFQMKFLDKVPIHAIFDETIEVAKLRGHEGQRRFVTGVLHQIKRQGVPATSAITNDLDRLAIEASLPKWLVDELVAQIGLEKTQKIAATINQAPSQSVRVNPVLADKTTITTELESAGFEVAPSPIAKDGLLVKGGFVAGTLAFQRGAITLQDESAMLVAEAMHIDQPSYQVLDTCAAPGGKTTQIASYLTPQAGGKVFAYDIHAHKVNLVAQNAARLGVAECVDALVGDARQLTTTYAPQTFDRVLVDAPCSGFGLLRRKPEIRYEKQMCDSLNLQKIQLAILEEIADLVKIGGLLTYSTCTILKTENDDVIAEFLAKHPDYQLVPTKTDYDVITNQTAKALTIYPDDFNSDGFFIASLKRLA